MAEIESVLYHESDGIVLITLIALTLSLVLGALLVTGRQCVEGERCYDHVVIPRRW